MSHFSATAWYTSRWQCDVIAAAVRHLFQRQCDTYLDGSATRISTAVSRLSRWQCDVYIRGSVMYVSAAVSLLFRWRCNVYLSAVRLYLGGSATYISAAVWHLSRRQCHIYLDAVWRIYRRQCHSYICVRDWYFVCSILLNMQCCDNNCGNFTQYFMSYIFSVLWLCMLYSESHMNFICGYLFIFSRITNVCGHE